MSDRPTMSMRELRDILRCDRTALRETVERNNGRIGPIQGIRIGERWRFPRRAVERWQQELVNDEAEVA